MPTPESIDLVGTWRLVSVSDWVDGDLRDAEDQVGEARLKARPVAIFGACSRRSDASLPNGSAR